MNAEAELGGRNELVADALRAASDDVVVACSDAESVEPVVTTVVEGDETPASLRLLLDEPTAKRVAENFIVASKMASLVDDRVLSVRSVDQSHPAPVFASADGVSVLASLDGGQAVRLGTEETSVVDALYQKYGSLWDGGRPVSMRTPSYARLLDTAAERLGEEVRDDLRRAFESPDVAREREDPLDAVDVAVLVAAMHNVQLYTLSKWGENLGVASRAKFSKEKRRLEDAGVIETEKVKGQVGRPRQQLVVSPDVLPDADGRVEALLSAATDALNTVRP